jgi:hypothetical protein
LRDGTRLGNHWLRGILVLALSVPCLGARQVDPPRSALTPERLAALGRVSAAMLRRHVAYLASDELEGRATPSRGLDLAAVYIADQFGCAGLDPLADGSYFQWGKEVSREGRRGTPRNVIGRLTGSAPALRDTFVLVTAHYDHLGRRAGGTGDRIFNGANDNASGVATLMEVAAALASLPQRPRRSIVFIAFYGEEEAMLGSKFYCQHPAFPLERTVAAINLEQLGRTDSSQGSQVARASVTGYDYSEVGAILREAGQLTGITIHRNPPFEESFFSRSDNQVLASQGIPAHTVFVAYVYPDYHQVTDHAEKIDYGNLEKVARMIALGTLRLAQASREPAWNPGVPRARHFRLAWRTRHRQ